MVVIYHPSSGYLRRMHVNCAVQVWDSSLTVKTTHSMYRYRFRPHVAFFLRRAAALFEVVLFTAATEVQSPGQLG